MDRFLIAPLRGGMVRNVRPWLIPNNAFETIRNAYLFRDRIRKRFGSRLLNSNDTGLNAQISSRLRVNIATTNGSGNLGATVVPGTIFKIGQAFSVGSTLLTVYQTNGAMLSSTPGVTGTYDTATGTVTITGATLGTSVFFFPSEPVMGLATLETTNVSDEFLVAFDTQFAYQYVATGFERLSGGADTWTSSNSEFFWATNYRGTAATDYWLYVTNNNEPIRYRNLTTNQWVDLVPALNTATGNDLVTALIVIPFQGRLLALNTTETDGVHINRLRYSQIGDPTDQGVGWLEAPSAYGRGGFIDAPTNEAIVTCEFVKDQLIVYFERSTWAVVYTGNQQLPFIWQQINTELGAESTHSIVPFDKVAIGVGNVGIHVCNGINVDRNDQLIPDEVFFIHNVNGGIERVYGIRDYYVEQVYWTYPDQSRTAERPWPNKVLVYNYAAGTWAINDDSITAFGYFQNPSSASTPSWVSPDVNWLSTSATWIGSPLEAKFRNVVAGNQQGFVFQVDADQTRNAPALQIDSIGFGPNPQLDMVYIQSQQHNLDVGDVVNLETLTGIVGPLTGYYEIMQLGSPIPTPTDPYNYFYVKAPDLYARLVAGDVYLGGGTIARVSRIDIYTKQYNFYNEAGTNIAINKVDFLVDRTDSGQFTVDYMPSFSTVGNISDGLNNQSVTGNSIVETSPYALYPQENTQLQLWHPCYLWVDGEAIQLRLYQTTSQLTNGNIALADFALHAMLFHAWKTASRLQ